MRIAVRELADKDVRQAAKDASTQQQLADKLAKAEADLKQAMAAQAALKREGERDSRNRQRCVLLPYCCLIRVSCYILVLA